MNPTDSLHLVLDRQASMRRDVQVLALARHARLRRKARRLEMGAGPVEAIVAVAPARPARATGRARPPIAAGYSAVR